MKVIVKMGKQHAVRIPNTVIAAALEAMRQTRNIILILLVEMIGRELAGGLGVRENSFDAIQVSRAS